MFKAKATRDERITSLAGFVYLVQAGETYEFPDVMQTEVVMAGCIPVESDKPAKVEVSEEDRSAAVYNAVVEVISKGDARLLGPEGYPKVSTIKKMVSFEPTIDEIVAAADQLKQED
jgi:hypothetical protein